MRKLPFLLSFIAMSVCAIIATETFNVNRLVATVIIGVVLLLLSRRSELTREDIGAGTVSKEAIYWSAAIFGSICIALGAVYLIAPSILMDARYNQSFLKTMVSMFVMLPLTTVLLEELAFRGVLLGYLLKAGSRKQALLTSSVLFGLWHVVSSTDVRVTSVPLIHNPPQLLVSITIVLVTAGAGLIFSLLRLKTKSILVPIVAHWSLNACGILFAWLAWHR